MFFVTRYSYDRKIKALDAKIRNIQGKYDRLLQRSNELYDENQRLKAQVENRTAPLFPRPELFGLPGGLAEAVHDEALGRVA